MKEVANITSVYTITPDSFNIAEHGLPEMLHDQHTPKHDGPVGDVPQGMAAGPIGRITILVHVDDPVVFASSQVFFGSTTAMRSRNAWRYPWQGPNMKLPSVEAAAEPSLGVWCLPATATVQLRAESALC